jgi:putative phage-type endonuclease
MDEEKFHAERRTGIGGSDAPVILGLSPWLTPLQLWAVKTGAIESALNYEKLKGESPQLTWGRRLQPLIVEAFRDETNRDVREHPDDLMLRHPEIPWLVGHLDGVQIAARGEGVFEAKNVIIYKRDRWFDEAPIEAKIQVQHYLAVTGYEFGSIAGLIGGFDFRWEDFERNQRFIDGLLEKEEKFWECVQRDIQPPAVARDVKFLNTLIPASPKTTVVLEAGWDDVDADLLAVKRQIEEVETNQLKPLIERRDQLEAQIKQRLGDAEAAELHSGVVYTFKQTDRKGYEVKPTSFRTLRRKGVQDHG